MRSARRTTPGTAASRLRVIAVYRDFNDSGSIPSLFRGRVERLAAREDVVVVCSRASRADTSAPLSFVDVEPLARGRGRLSYAVECASFARRAARAVAAIPDVDVVYSEGFATLRADLVAVHAVRPGEIEDYFTLAEPTAGRLRRVLHARVLRPQSGAVMGIERRLYASSPICLTPSARVKGQLERHYGVPGSRIEVLPYGIELDPLLPAPDVRAATRARLGVADDRLVVLFVGHDVRRKGLVRAIAGIAQARSAASIDLWVVAGPSPDLERARAEAARLGVATHLTGFVDRAELLRLYQGADVVVLPSELDTWALPVVEGMAAERVVVASEYAGSSELIVDGENGFVLPGRGEAEAIAALLDGPLAEQPVRARLGASARAAVQHVAYDAVHERFVEALHRAAGRPGRGAREPSVV